MCKARPQLLALFVLLAVATTAQAQTLPANPHLDRARELFGQVRYHDTARELDLALAHRGNSPAQLSEIHALMGTVQVALGERRAAAASFACLLAIDPGFRFPPAESPKVVAALEQVRHSGVARSPQACGLVKPAQARSATNPASEPAAQTAQGGIQSSSSSAPTESTAERTAQNKLRDTSSATPSNNGSGAQEGLSEGRSGINGEGSGDILLWTGLATVGLCSVGAVLLVSLAAANESAVYNADNAVEDRQDARQAARFLWAAALVDAVVLAIGGAVTVAGVMR